MTSARCARSARFFTLAALLLLTAATAGAQQPQRPSPAQASVTVQGHWIIEVRNADGSGVKRYEFDNALVDARPLLLTLSRQNSAAHWNVGLGDFYGDGEPCLLDGTPPTPTSCFLQEPGDARVFSFVKKLPVLTVSLEGGAAGKLVLQGTFTAENTGQISSVNTGMAVCPNTVAPATPCTSGPSFFLTRHTTLPSGAPSAGGPIPVAAGQIVQVRVEIRFSSASAS